MYRPIYPRERGLIGRISTCNRPAPGLGDRMSKHGRVPVTMADRRPGASVT